MWTSQLFGGSPTKVGSNIFANVYNDQMHIAWLLPSGQPGGVGTVFDVFFTSFSITQAQPTSNGISATSVPVTTENSQYLNNGGKTKAPPAVAGPVIGAYSSQQHFGYIDKDGAIRDCWYEAKTSAWAYQKINGPNGRTSGPAAAIEETTSHPLCIWNDPKGAQLHFTYRSSVDSFVYDAYWDSNSGSWILQKITGPGSRTPNGPAAASSPFASNFNQQQHIAYKDSQGSIWDSWYDGSGQWALQKINTPQGTSPGKTAGPAAHPGDSQPFVWIDPSSSQLHYTYLGEDTALYDAYYDSNQNGWKLQKLNGPGGIAPSAPTSANGPFVSLYNSQQHIVYISSSDGAIWDIFYDGAGHWNSQKINSPANQPPGVTSAPAAKTNGKLFVLHYASGNEGDTQNFFYFDKDHNIWVAEWTAD